RLPARARRWRDRPRPHPGRARRGADRRETGPDRRGRAHGLRVARARNRGPGRCRLRRPARARDRHGHERGVLIPLLEIERARERIEGAATRTPLVRLDVPDAPAEIWLKLENLQPIASFKIRGAVNAIRQASRDDLARGVVTASAGNMAQGVAWAAR